ncbi:MAG: 3'-5' exonuclease [Myxococcota bacterium]
MTPALAHRLQATRATLQAARAAFGPQSIAGVMRLETERRELTVLLGSSQKAEGPLALVDWQTAPLAEVFFSCGEGDRYELTIEERAVKGRLLDKALTRLEDGELVELWCDAGHAWRDAHGQWHSGRAERPLIPGRAKAKQLPYRSPLEVTLDAAQQRAVDLPRNRHVLLLGEAGFGKTTVALHRLVALKERHGRGFQGAVLVPTDGLRRLTELMLERRGVEGIEVWTFDAWARDRAHKAFRGLPRQESVDATSRVVQLKRHGALRATLPAFVKTRPRNTTGRRDLLHLFGDTAWLERVVAAAGGRLHAAAVAEVAEHTRVQFSKTTEDEYRDVEADRLAALDGRRLDEGTPMEDANSIDVEDYPVLFEIERLRAEAAGHAPRRLGGYDAVVLDEAQEFGPLELAMVSRALAPKGCLIVAGDAAQQVDETADFGGWERVMSDVGARDFERVVLEVNYRCPPEVTTLARHVLGQSAAPPDDVQSILKVRRAHPCHTSAWVGEALSRLVGSGPEADPLASVAVILRTPEQARHVAKTLGYSVPVHLALGGDFLFKPGVVVTCVAEVKGLEFDVVVLPDAGDGTWPATADARRSLYVALTRASHRLVLLTHGAWSPLLGEARRQAS